MTMIRFQKIKIFAFLKVTSCTYYTRRINILRKSGAKREREKVFFRFPKDFRIQKKREALASLFFSALGSIR